MSSISIVRRRLLRLLVLAVLLTALVGVPFVVLRVVGVTAPATTWHAVWRQQRLSSDAAVQLGLACFLLLWAWFATTAVCELGRVWHHRHDAAPAGRVRLGDGPAGWIRGAVRFIALSSVSAAVVTGGLGAGAHAAAPPPAHVVTVGDTYWSIADAQLDLSLGRDARPDEVWAHTKELVQWNAPRLGHRDPTLLIPGETVWLTAPPATADSVTEATAPTTIDAAQPAPAPVPPPMTAAPVTTALPSVPATTAPVQVVASPPPPASAPSSAVTATVPPPTVGAVAVADAATARDALARLDEDSGLSASTLIGAGMLAAGVLAAVRMRRGRVLRSSPSGSRLDAPSFRAARLELQLRAIEPAERLARLEVALRAAAPALASQASSVLAVTMDPLGEIRLFLSAAAVPTDDMWRADLVESTWRLPALVPLEVVAAAGADVAAFPCPGLVQVGQRDGYVDDGADVYVDLEAVGVLALDSPLADAIADMIATTIAWSPWMEGGEVLAEASVAADCEEIERVAGGAELWARVSERQSAVGAGGAGTTVAARLADGANAWVPLIAVDRGAVPHGCVVQPNRGVGVVVLGASSTPFRIRADGDRHVLEPFGIGLRPSLIDRSTSSSAAELVTHAAALPLAIVPDSMPLRPEPATDSGAGSLDGRVWREPRWDVLVTLLGQVTVQDRSGRAAEFEKAKSMELLVWLTRHRERPTRSAARSALWDLAVRDSTFANVVSDCRRSLARLVPPPQGEEWVARTLSDDLPLHPRVITDAELLAGRVEAARGLPPEEAIAILRPGVELLHGMPFSGPGAGYLWVDGEGHTSSLVLLATGAAEQLALHHLALGDIDGVFWATDRGLRVLPGHEELIALRMRAHAMRGDTAGVRLEWEQYERALAADAWSGDEPSPKLAALRRELLSPATSRRT